MSTCHASRILARTVVAMGVWWGQKEAVETWGEGQDLGREGGVSRGCCGPEASRTQGWGMDTVRSHGRSQGLELGRWSVPGAGRCPGRCECGTCHTVRQVCGMRDTTRGWGDRPVEGLLGGQSHGEGVRRTPLLPPPPGRRVQGDEGAWAVHERCC